MATKILGAELFYFMISCKILTMIDCTTKANSSAHKEVASAVC